MNLLWSSVRFSEARREDRFGAEFWKPEYLEPLKKDRNWQLIGDLLQGVQYGISREMNEDGVGLPIFRMNEMEGLFLSSPEKHVLLEEGEDALFSLSPGDVLFNRTNSLKYVGRTGILKEPLRAVFASYLIRLVPDARRLLPEYLTVYLNTPTGIGQVERRAMESINQANVSGSEIRKVPIPVMPMAFQNSVAKAVDAAGERRIQARKTYALAEELLLSELGLGSTDLSSPLLYERDFSEAHQSRRFDAEYFQPKYYALIDAIQRTARYRVLREIATYCERGLQPQYDEEGEVIVVNTKHMGTQFLSGDFERCSLAAWNSQKKARLKKHDVLVYSTGAYIGRTNYWFADEMAIASNHVTIVRPTTECNPVYLALFMNSQAELTTSGSPCPR